MKHNSVQQIMIGKMTNNYTQTLSTLCKIKELGYDEIELNRFMIHKPGIMVKLMTKFSGMPIGNGGKLDWHALIKYSKLNVSSLHIDLNTIENNIEECANEAKSFGTDKIVITGMYNFDYSDTVSLKNICDRLNSCGEKLKNENISLLYHNHNCELRKASGITAYEYIINNTNPDYVNFEFDSYWFIEAGADPIYWMDKLGHRMKLWHINDRGTRINGKAYTPILKTDSMELGYGNIDLDSLYRKAEALGVETVILESHKNWIDKDPIKSIELSSKFLCERKK